MPVEYSYQQMVADWGYQVVMLEPFGDYQGDYAVLLQDGEKYGWVTIGYGSCSGCDTMEYLSYGGAENREKEYAEFSDQVRGEIKWDSATGLADWLTDTVIQEGKYSWYADGYREFVERAIGVLRSST